jgi:hypothetical protein
VVWAPIPYSPGGMDRYNRDYAAPGGEQRYKNANGEIVDVPSRFRHKMGTDGIGRDLTSGLIHGTRISLMVGLVSMGIAALIGIILVMGIGSYFLYNQYETVKAENVALTFAVEEQKKTIEVIKENFERQGKALNNLTARNAEIEGEMTRYLDIFKRHNLNKLAIAKPGLIEKRVNDGTAKIFITIENDSKILDNLDDASTTDN